MLVRYNRCLRCGHEWQSRLDEMPNRCPHCKSQKWNAVRKVTESTLNA